jgi:hypothetical protein
VLFHTYQQLLKVMSVGYLTAPTGVSYGVRPDPAHAIEWVERPGHYVGTGTAFAIWIPEDAGRLRAGDLAFVRPTQPPQSATPSWSRQPVGFWLLARGGRPNQAKEPQGTIEQKYWAIRIRRLAETDCTEVKPLVRVLFK